jgi:hypothetical protein
MQKLFEEIIKNTEGLYSLGVPIVDGMTVEELIELRNGIRTKIPFGASMDGMEYGDVEGCVVAGLKIQSLLMLKQIRDHKRSAQKSVQSSSKKVRITHEKYPEGHKYHDPHLEEYAGIHSTDAVMITGFYHGEDTSATQALYVFIVYPKNMIFITFFGFVIFWKFNDYLIL